MPASSLDLLRIFYSSGARFLPVVDGGRLLGIIDRSALTALSADSSRASETFDSIPSELFLVDQYPPEVFQTIGAGRRCTVVTPGAEPLEMESARVLALISAKAPDVRSAPVERPRAPEEVNLWLSRLLLSAIPYPLYALDLKGKTLFYNGAFESAVLSHASFRSVAKCERTFLELSRELLAASIALGREKEPVRGALAETGAPLWMITLSDAGRVAGYLFVFQWMGAIESDLFERMTAEGMDAVMDSIERAVLLEALGRTDYNISRTADMLQTRRTTLQSRMKRLRLPLKARAARAKSRARKKPAPSKPSRRTARKKRTRKK